MAFVPLGGFRMHGSPRERTGPPRWLVIVAVYAAMAVEGAIVAGLLRLFL